MGGDDHNNSLSEFQGVSEFLKYDYITHIL